MDEAPCVVLVIRGRVLDIYPQVHAHLGACGWILPRAEFYAYPGGLVRAGFSERLMFGSDHMFWPDLIGASVEAVDFAGQVPG